MTSATEVVPAAEQHARFADEALVQETCTRAYASFQQLRGKLREQAAERGIVPHRRYCAEG